LLHPEGALRHAEEPTSVRLVPEQPLKLVEEAVVRLLAILDDDDEAGAVLAEGFLRPSQDLGAVG
jgi:hypothetical protein